MDYRAFATLSQTNDQTRTLEEVAQIIETLKDTRIRSNVAASTGLVLNKDVIKRILRLDGLKFELHLQFTSIFSR